MKQTETKKSATNKEIAYQLIQSCCKSDGAEGEPIYGVEVISTYINQVCTRIEDISPNVNVVKKLLQIFKKKHITPSQAIYIVEDYLEELNTNRSYPYQQAH